MTCVDEATYCLTCRSDDSTEAAAVKQSSIVLKHHVCVSRANHACESGTFFDLLRNECALCDLTCDECAASSAADRCVKCAGMRPLLQEGRCLAQCEPGYFLTMASGRSLSTKCLKCDRACETCEKSPRNCLICKKGLVLNENRECVPKVFDGK